MRLTPNQSATIKNIIQQSLGEDCEVWLFGSRVDDHSKGGDIDLYVETKQSCHLQQKLRLMSKIQRAIGMRKIDLLIKTPTSEDKTIYCTAKNEGVLL